MCCNLCTISCFCSIFSGEASGSDSDVEKNSEDENDGQVQERKKRKRSTSKVEAEDDNSNPLKEAEEEKGGSNHEDIASDEEQKPPKKRTKERVGERRFEQHPVLQKWIMRRVDRVMLETVKIERRERRRRHFPIPSESKKSAPEFDELPQLHRTASIFLRNLAPSITKQRS